MLLTSPASYRAIRSRIVLSQAASISGVATGSTLLKMRWARVNRWSGGQRDGLGNQVFYRSTHVGTMDWNQETVEDAVTNDLSQLADFQPPDSANHLFENDRDHCPAQSLL